jgi:hypothetical protein
MTSQQLLDLHQAQEQVVVGNRDWVFIRSPLGITNVKNSKKSSKQKPNEWLVELTKIT